MTLLLVYAPRCWEIPLFTSSWLFRMLFSWGGFQALFCPHNQTLPALRDDLGLPFLRRHRTTVASSLKSLPLSSKFPCDHQCFLEELTFLSEACCRFYFLPPHVGPCSLHFFPSHNLIPLSPLDFSLEFISMFKSPLKNWTNHSHKYPFLHPHSSALTNLFPSLNFSEGFSYFYFHFLWTSL